MNRLPPPTFLDVKAILTWLVKGKEQKLKQKHGPTFGWATRAQLLAAKVELSTKTYPLIAPDLVGNGRGGETYLVQALSPAGVDGWNMPYLGNDEGAFATPLQLATLVAWIDAGCPD